MSNFNKWLEILETKMDIQTFDFAEILPCKPINFMCVLTVPNPADPKKQISNVMCRYRMAGSEISFQKNPFNADESFEDALRWAKTFAQRHGISTVYAADFSVGPT
ncbi:MAG: hypothetical protein GKS00_16955 [Alphaproteobacteria bacterium]|nr:hypothetical protein [Alphaproteobacteria bacterium]